MADRKTAACFKGIEELKKEQKVSDAVFEGIKAANGWKTGKRVEETVFKRAVEAFLNGRVDGSRRDKEAKG